MPKRGWNVPRRPGSSINPPRPPSGGNYPLPMPGGGRHDLVSAMGALKEQKAAAKSAHDSAEIKRIRDAMKANRAARSVLIAKKKAK